MSLVNERLYARTAARQILGRVEGDVDMSTLPCEVPPFPLVTEVEKPTYTWWTWHPRSDLHSPKWSKTCWGSTSMPEAVEMLGRPHAHSLTFSHCKLILDTNGRLEEVLDLPTLKGDDWLSKEQRAAKEASS